MRLKTGCVSGLVGLRNNHVLGVFLVLLVLTLVLVGLKPTQAQFDTLITQVDAGSGSVSPNCLSGCSETGGDTITVTAIPSGGWQFSSWSLGGTVVVPCIVVTSNSCYIVMPALGGFTIIIGATFTQLPTTTTTTAAPIPEYPYGLPLLAILLVIGYGLVRRRINY